MINKKQFLTSMILGVSSVSLASHSAQAEKTKMEECYGVAKAGKNDCGVATGKHSCAGTSTVDGDVNEWILLPSGVCERIVGGKLKK